MVTILLSPTAGTGRAPSVEQPSYLLPDAGTEQTGGAEQKDHDEDGEHHRFTPLRPQVRLREFADHADDQPAEDRAGDVPDAPEDGRGKGV